MFLLWRKAEDYHPFPFQKSNETREVYRLRDNEHCSIHYYEKREKHLILQSDRNFSTKRNEREGNTYANVEGEAPVKATSAPFNAHLIDLMLNINEATRSSGWAQHIYVHLRVHEVYRET